MRVCSCHSLSCTLSVRIYCIMLCCSSNSTIFLQSLHHLYAKFSHEIRVLTINLLIASPSLISSYVKNRSIDVGISQKSCLLTGDPADITDQFLVPGTSKSQLSREICCHISLDSANTLIGEIHGNSKPCLLHKETLDFIQSPRMLACRPYIWTFSSQRPTPTDE